MYSSARTQTHAHSAQLTLAPDREPMGVKEVDFICGWIDGYRWPVVLHSTYVWPNGRVCATVSSGRPLMYDVVCQCLVSSASVDKIPCSSTVKCRKIENSVFEPSTDATDSLTIRHFPHIVAHRENLHSNWISIENWQLKINVFPCQIAFSVVSELVLRSISVWRRAAKYTSPQRLTTHQVTIKLR